jgi:hypothetical protein
MDPLQASGRELGSEPVEPVVDVVGGQLGELGRPDQREDVLLGQDAVGRDRFLIAALEVFGQPVLDRVRHGVALNGLEAGVPVGYGLDQLVLYEASWRPVLCGAEAGSRLPLLHEGPATRDGPDQALVRQHLDGSPHGHRGQARFLNQVDDARDLPPRRVHPGLDPLPQDGSQLLERELGRIMVNLHVITLASMIM